MTTTDRETTDCPLCGKTVDSAHLSRHKDSKKCNFLQDQQIIAENNLVQVPASSRFRIRLEELGYEIYRLIKDYDIQRSQRYNGNVISKAYFAEESGVEQVSNEVLPDPTNNGIHASISEKMDDYWICYLSNPSNAPYTEDVICVELDAITTTSSRRVLYIDDSVAYSSDGYRIGTVKTLDEMIETGNISKETVVSYTI